MPKQTLAVAIMHAGIDPLHAFAGWLLRSFFFLLCECKCGAIVLLLLDMAC